jgi:hypothetical protein
MCFIFQRAQDVIRWGWSQLPREADQQAIDSVAHTKPNFCRSRVSQCDANFTLRVPHTCPTNLDISRDASMLMKAKAQAISMKGIQSNITITLYFSRLLVQDLDSFSVFPFLVTFQKVDGEPKAIAMRLFVFPQRKFQTACLVSFIIFFWGKDMTIG